MPGASKSPRKKQLSQVFQFKITLLDTRPPIWRRIQVADSRLDDLHEHIQTAMGWTNSHLHQFEIDGQNYGDPALLAGDWGGDSDFLDSTALRLSQIFAKNRSGFRFFYEYDFGDGWRHEIVLEESKPAEPGTRYPRCIQGSRACPPDDCGGPWGYQEFLEAIRDPKHEQHESMLEWIGGQFDPEKFNPTAATKAMHRGLPDWRSDF